MMHNHQLTKAEAKTSGKKKESKKLEKEKPSRRDKLSPHRGKRNQRLIRPYRRLAHNNIDCYSAFLSLNQQKYPIIHTNIGMRRGLSF